MITDQESLTQLGERLSNEREQDKERERRLVHTTVMAVLALSLGCRATLVYFGEWPQAWEFLEVSGSFLDLLAWIGGYKAILSNYGSPKSNPCLRRVP